MTEPLLRDGLSEFGRALFEAADAEAPSPAARDALLAAIAGTAAVTTSVTTASSAAALKGGLAAKAGASASAGAGIATKGAAALGAKLLVASAISVATTAAVVGELREARAPSPPAVVATVASGATSRPRMPVAAAPSSPEVPKPTSFEEAVEEPTAATVVDAPPATAPSVGAVRAPGSLPTDRAPDTAEPSPEAAREDTSTSTEDTSPPTSTPSSPPAGRSVAVDPPVATSESASASPPVVARPSAPPSPRGASSDDAANVGSLGAQIASIDAARVELRSGNARGALATIDAFDLRYGKSAALSPEAMLLRVQAHLALGERRLAESTAAALMRDHPTSVSARRAAILIGKRD